MPDDHTSIAPGETTDHGSRRMQAIIETVVAAAFFGVLCYAALSKLSPGRFWNLSGSAGLASDSVFLAMLIAAASAFMMTGLVIALPLRLRAISRDEALEQERLRLEALERMAREEELTAQLRRARAEADRNAEPVACTYCGVIREAADSACAACGARRS